MTDPEKRLSEMGETAMGHFGRLTKLADLPSDKILIRYVKEAAKLNEEGIKISRKPKSTEKKPLIVPKYFKKALNKNKIASKNL